MKTCIHCHEVKPLSEYYRHPKMSDGHLGACKSCHKSKMTHRRRTNPAVQAYDRERYKRPERKALGALIAKRWRQENPDGYRAHTAVNNAVRDGKILKQPCKVCGTMKNLHAHHHDYKKPLDVEWLCALHHHRHHGEI